MTLKEHVKIVALFICLSWFISLVTNITCLVIGHEFKYMLYWFVPSIVIVAWAITVFVIVPIIEKIIE